MGNDDLGLGAAESFKSNEDCQNMFYNIQALLYEEEFLKLSRIKPLHRLYFMVKKNPGEQYYNFVLLAAWLITKCGIDMELPQESDDPNTVISNILGIMRNMGGTVDFSPSKVKSGWGPEVVQVLSFLSEQAAEKNGLNDEEDSNSAVEEEAEEDDEEEEYIERPVGPVFQELDMEKVEEEMGQYYMSDDEEGEGDAEPDLAWTPATEDVKNKSADASKEKLKILESNTDAEKWRLELERVLPQLKITVKPDAHDWRWRYEQMENYTKSISEALEHLEVPLGKMVSEARDVIEKVHTRESYLSSQVEGLLSQLAATQEKITETRAKHREQGVELTNKTRQLAKLTDDVEETRRQLDDRGAVMADGAPVAQVRKALGTLKREMADMEVEIGVMEHHVLKSLVQEQVILRDKSNAI